MGEREVADLLKRQHGLITRQQAIDAGLRKPQVRYRTDSGEWERVHYGLYRHAMVPRTWRSDALLGVLATGGVASHETAARLHGIELPRRRRRRKWIAEVSVEHGRWRDVDNVVVHQSTQIDRIDQVEITGIACTGLARTVLDLGASLSVTQLGSVVDSLLRTGRVTQRELWSVLIRHARCGRNGSGVLRAVLEERLGENRIALSDWSYFVADLLESGGLPRPRLEFRVHDPDGRFIAQVDLAYPEQMLAIELDSVAFHSDLVAFRRDRSRARELTVEGWAVLQFTWDVYADTPADLVSQVRAVLMRESAQ